MAGLSRPHNTLQLRRGGNWSKIDARQQIGMCATLLYGNESYATTVSWNVAIDRQTDSFASSSHHAHFYQLFFNAATKKFAQYAKSITLLYLYRYTWWIFSSLKQSFTIPYSGFSLQYFIIFSYFYSFNAVNFSLDSISFFKRDNVLSVPKKVPWLIPWFWGYGFTMVNYG